MGSILLFYVGLPLLLIGLDLAIAVAYLAILRRALIYRKRMGLETPPTLVKKIGRRLLTLLGLIVGGASTCAISFIMAMAKIYTAYIALLTITYILLISGLAYSIALCLKTRELTELYKTEK